MLEVDRVTKTYGGRTAINEVSFTVGDGRITGFVGGNGAGKTTTMRIILGVLSADSGAVSLGGSRLSGDDRRIFGYMPEERGLYPKMKVAEQITYFGRLHGMTARDAAASTTRLLDRLELGARANDTVDALSLGNQQRAQIAAALVHQPEVLILDEPFSGLDPMGVDTVLGVLRDAASDGAPVLFSSHQLDLVERLCDDLVIIANGEIRASGSREQLQREHGHDRYQLDVDGDLGWLREVPGITVVDFDGGHALFEAADAAAAQSVLKRAVADGTVQRFAPQHPSLAQIFREVIQ
ncbi:ATP-binding cassette domain-containing protein [Glaciihabitans sp. INWT7]|uniref:ABC transporter ATP-binding protein n=1 Tax=Glaciihabitans sp. INWT7 TaxID=2596912 RepID=UPI0016233414|nr:ATP-binding cassette domain-containing protein [Glaciihabitans sp. INWT7]QNE48147.1 ATP-binding cassette domain-containing protein [Glaciihabitans sp. INWT7]